MGTLYNSNLCRLCAVESNNNFILFESNGEEKIDDLINSYLPIKVKNDGRLPKKICLHCKLNLHDVISFFNCIVEGQKVLYREISKEETPTQSSDIVTIQNFSLIRKCQYDEDNKLIIEMKDALKEAFQRKKDDCKSEITSISNEPVKNERKKMFSDQHSLLEQPSLKKDENKVENNLYQISSQKNTVKAPNMCDICGKYPRNLKIHKFLAHNMGNEGLKTFSCDICGEKFCHRNSIIYHVHSKHGEKRFYNCNKCGKEFSSSGLLNRHIKCIHTLTRFFECAECHATFTAEDDLGAHSRSCCNQNTFACKVCKKICEFGKAHECRKKKQLKEYRCDLCDKIFPYSSNLYRHRKLHSNERPYHCTKCDRKFPTSSRLKMHENEHKKEYSYKCDICQKTFINNRVLRVHRRRHTRVFPFECDVCCKGFPDKFTLVKHMRVHTGERPYRCEICDKSFADQSNYLRHRKGHSKQKPNKNIKKLVASNVVGTQPLQTDFSSFSYRNSVSELISTTDSKSKEKSIHTSKLLHLVQSSNNKSSKKHVENDKNSTTDVSSKKRIYLENNVKQVLFLESTSKKNLVMLPPLVIDPLTKGASQVARKEDGSPLVLKSMRRQNSYVIVSKKARILPTNNCGTNDSPKVIVIRSANKNKPKIIMQRSAKSKNRKELPGDTDHLASGCWVNGENGETDDDDQNRLPELYSYEEMAPSPTSSEYIDVEDLVATFTPNISFEEIGDLKDLVNTKIDL